MKDFIPLITGMLKPRPCLSLPLLHFDSERENHPLGTNSTKGQYPLLILATHVATLLWQCICLGVQLTQYWLLCKRLLETPQRFSREAGRSWNRVRFSTRMAASVGRVRAATRASAAPMLALSFPCTTDPYRCRVHPTLSGQRPQAARRGGHTSLGRSQFQRAYAWCCSGYSGTGAKAPLATWELHPAVAARIAGVPGTALAAGGTDRANIADKTCSKP